MLRNQSMGTGIAGLIGRLVLTIAAPVHIYHAFHFGPVTGNHQNGRRNCRRQFCMHLPGHAKHFP